MNAAETVPIAENQIFMLVLGPLGALVLAVTVAVVLWRENKALQQSILTGEREWQKKLDTERDELMSQAYAERTALQAKLESEKANIQTKLETTNNNLLAKLDEERSVRLREALANAKAMEHWNSELHLTQKQLTEAVYRQNLSKGQGQT